MGFSGWMIYIRVSGVGVCNIRFASHVSPDTSKCLCLILRFSYAISRFPLVFAFSIISLISLSSPANLSSGKRYR